ncbi:Mg2+/Co2+ transporter [Microbacterium laevaniformans OR221]|jgi:magnesium transporter|nr:Mg2+/Co2+ transporter [Microbacterium laevaniformans OR221]
MAQPQCVVYDGGIAHPTDAAPVDALAEARRRGGMLWVGLSAQSADEVSALADALQLERLGVATALRTHQRSKLERFGDHLFVVVQPS